MKPRVLHVSAVDFTAAKLLAPQLSHLEAAGYDVRVACKRTDSAHWETLSNFRPIDVPFPRALKPLDMLAASRILSTQVREWRPDILHLHTPAASLPVRALPSWMWAGASVFYTVHGFLHMWPPNGLKERIVQKVEQFEARRTAVMLFQSREDFSMARQHGYRSDLVFLGNGVEDSWFELAPRPRGPVLQLLYVGRLVREKGIIELLDALIQVEDVHLHIAGAALSSDRDPVADEIRRRVGAKPLSGRVSLHGMLSREDLQRLLGESDALCLPSYREGVPRSVIEALAAGKPVLATDIRGSRELIQDGENGFLVQPRDPASLAGGLTKLSSLDAQAFGAMGRKARSSADPTRRESHVCARLVAAYRAAGVTPA